MNNVQIVHGDIFTSNVQAIVHQTNCYGRMGSGFALKIRQHYPEVYEEYFKLCQRYNPDDLFGAIQTVQALNGRYIINLFGQKEYGRDKQYTNYDAIQNGLNLIVEHNPNIKTLGFPYKMGCTLGGGDWSIMYQLIDNTFKQVDKEIYIFKLED